MTTRTSIVSTSAYRVSQMRHPCAVGQAPHHWTPWKTIVTGTGRITLRTCTECGAQDDDGDRVEA